MKHPERGRTHLLGQQELGWGTKREKTFPLQDCELSSMPAIEDCANAAVNNQPLLMMPSQGHNGQTWGPPHGMGPAATPLHMVLSSGQQHSSQVDASGFSKRQIVKDENIG